MTHTPIKIFSMLFVLTLLVMPQAAGAASLKPSCELTVSTPRGSVEISEDADVLIKPGEKVTLEWTSKNATKGTNYVKAKIPLRGSEVIVPTKNVTYSYTFSSGSKKVTCSALLVLANAEIDPTSLVSEEKKPTLTGEIDAKTAQITVKNAKGKVVVASKEIKVKKGTWKWKSSKVLAPGSYEVILSGPKSFKLNALATSTLLVSKKGSVPVKTGTISVSGVPLLMGGNAAPGASVPVAYIKVTNTGKVLTAIEGFRLTENGSAPDDVVIGFTTSDDKGGSRSTIGGTEGTRSFKNGAAFIPLTVTIAPGQIRIFTIKAIMSRDSKLAAGTQLKIDVSGVEGTTEIKGSFPIRGTTFTLTY